MKNTIIYIPILVLLLALLALPIFDFFIDQENLTVGSGPNVVTRAIITIIMAYILIMPNRSQTRRFHNLITSCIVFFVIYISAITIWFFPLTSKQAYELVQIVYSWLGFLCFYKLTKYYDIDERVYAYFFFILIAIIAVTAYLNIDKRLDTDRGLDVADNTGNALVCAYAGIMLLANKKALPFAAMFLVIVGTLICGKRSAILATSAASLPLLIYMLTNKNVKFTRRFLFIVLIVIGAFVALRYFSSYFDAAIERFENIEEDEGSGRGWIYEEYWNNFLISKPIHQLFGHGLFAGARPLISQYAFTHVAAHNDWLEILFDFGLVGVFTYALILILVLIVIIKNINNRNIYFYMLCMSFIIWITESIFSSTFLMNMNSIYLYMSVAYAIAKLESNPKSNKTNELASTPDE